MAEQRARNALQKDPFQAKRGDILFELMCDEEGKIESNRYVVCVNDEGDTPVFQEITRNRDTDMGRLDYLRENILQYPNPNLQVSYSPDSSSRFYQNLNDAQQFESLEGVLGDFTKAEMEELSSFFDELEPTEDVKIPKPVDLDRKPRTAPTPETPEPAQSGSMPEDKAAGDAVSGSGPLQRDPMQAKYGDILLEVSCDENGNATDKRYVLCVNDRGKAPLFQTLTRDTNLPEDMLSAMKDYELKHTDGKYRFDYSDMPDTMRLYDNTKDALDDFPNRYEEIRSAHKASAAKNPDVKFEKKTEPGKEPASKENTGKSDGKKKFGKKDSREEGTAKRGRLDEQMNQKGPSEGEARRSTVGPKEGSGKKKTFSKEPGKAMDDQLKQTVEDTIKQYETKDAAKDLQEGKSRHGSGGKSPVNIDIQAEMQRFMVRQMLMGMMQNMSSGDLLHTAAYVGGAFFVLSKCGGVKENLSKAFQTTAGQFAQGPLKQFGKTCEKTKPNEKIPYDPFCAAVDSVGMDMAMRQACLDPNRTAKSMKQASDTYLKRQQYIGYRMRSDGTNIKTFARERQKMVCQSILEKPERASFYGIEVGDDNWNEIVRQCHAKVRYLPDNPNGLGSVHAVVDSYEMPAGGVCKPDGSPWFDGKDGRDMHIRMPVVSKDGFDARYDLHKSELKQWCGPDEAMAISRALQTKPPLVATQSDLRQVSRLKGRFAMMGEQGFTQLDMENMWSEHLESLGQKAPHFHKQAQAHEEPASQKKHFDKEGYPDGQESFSGIDPTFVPSAEGVSEEKARDMARKATREMEISESMPDRSRKQESYDEISNREAKHLMDRWDEEEITAAVEEFGYQS